MSIPDFPFQLPEVEESSIIFEESIFKIRRDQLRLPDRHYRYYTLLTKPSSVIVLALTEEGQYVLTEEYRHPTGLVLLSCPGGYIDGEESPLEAARRELLEETGFEAHSFEILGHAFPYAGISGQKVFYVKATQASFTREPSLEHSELIKTTCKSKRELEEIIQQGTPVDGNLCTALFFDSLRKD